MTYTTSKEMNKNELDNYNSAKLHDRLAAVIQQDNRILLIEDNSRQLTLPSGVRERDSTDRESLEDVVLRFTGQTPTHTNYYSTYTSLSKNTPISHGIYKVNIDSNSIDGTFYKRRQQNRIYWLDPYQIYDEDYDISAITYVTMESLVRDKSLKYEGEVIF